MIDIEKLSPKTFRIAVAGAFFGADAKRLVDFAKERTEAGGSDNVLIDLTSLADFSLAGISEELVHIPALFKWVYTLDRIAVIADEAWIRSMARLESALLPNVEYQVYDDDEADAAKAWIMEESDRPHAGALRVIEPDNPKVAAFELAGRLDRTESEAGIELIRKRLEAPECSRLMMVIRRWHGFEMDTAFSPEVMKGKLALVDQLDRYAIVGGPDWIRTLAATVGSMLKPEVRAFDLDDLDDAKEWLNE